MDALASFGVVHTDMPVTLANIWLAIQGPACSEGPARQCSPEQAGPWMASQMLASVKGMSACTTPNEASASTTEASCEVSQPARTSPPRSPSWSTFEGLLTN